MSSQPGQPDPFRKGSGRPRREPRPVIPAELQPLLTPTDSYDARPVVEWLVRQAAQQGASDLHLRPTPEELEVLLRRDGVLSRIFGLAPQLSGRLLVGLKNMARMASYKISTPQDGKFTVGELEVRVATAPTQFGEKAVLRLLTPPQGLRGLDQLGFSSGELTTLKHMVEQPQGLLLATGPAGSGKTTTLISLMRWLYGRHQELLGPTPGARLNVVTLEDPVEIVVPEFCQTSIMAEMGMTFGSGLRAMLRQDPELILVGEIRDPETAHAVVQASLTGHLVFSTLHARDTLGTIPRLLEMGAAPYQVAASLTGVVYQRLLRSLCAACKEAGQPDLKLRHERQRLGLEEGPEWRPRGCPACQQTGYAGRSAVCELLEVSDELRQAVLDRLPLHSLSHLREPLRAAALRRVGDGTTSYAEVCRTVPA